MSWPQIVQRLSAGESVTLNPRGGSMVPRIKSGQEVTIHPVEAPDRVHEGSVVLAKVKGRYYLHLVSKTDGDRIQISNNHGHVNGWTHRDKIYGWVDV